ncbi:MAG: PQQ-binding-like beta-propeller repeat protein [Pyrinomonadaceae bacterium]
MKLFKNCFKLVPLITVLASAHSAAADWPQWRGPNRDAVVSDASLPSTWPKALKEEWRVTVGVGHSSPVLSNGRLYVFARQGEEEVLLCLDAVSGKEIWRSSQTVAYEMHSAARGHGKGPKSTPVVSGGNVCTLGISGVVSCHDTRTGKLKWSVSFPGFTPTLRRFTGRQCLRL